MVDAWRDRRERDTVTVTVTGYFILAAYPKGK
jgi:hypothetical protein